MSPCHAGPGAAGAGPGVGAAGVVFNAPRGERDDAEREPGDVSRGESKSGCSGVGALKVCTVKGGGPGGGA